MFICAARDKLRVFREMWYEKIAWSGDMLPTCPRCGKTPYDKDWDDAHYEVKVNPINENKSQVTCN